MLELEDRLIHEISCGNKEGALRYYKELFDSLRARDMGKNCQIKSIKHYIICLNSILYRNSCDNQICKKTMFKKRNNFIDEVEEQNSVETLFELGQQIIMFYIETITSICICVQNPIIKEALAHIHSHIDKELTLESVAKAIHISKNHLSNLFLKSTDYSFSNYVNKVRVEKSKRILKNTNKSILNIALECGFNSQSYFCCAFKKVTGITPSEYRTFNDED